MQQGKKFLNTIRRLAIFLMFTICGYQLLESYNDWNAKPLAKYTLEESKHNIPFPSVTVCPEGFGLGSGVRDYLNKIEFKEEYKDQLKLTYKEFVRLKYWIAPYTDHDNDIDDCFGNPNELVEKSRYCRSSARIRILVLLRLHN